MLQYYKEVSLPLVYVPKRTAMLLTEVIDLHLEGVAEAKDTSLEDPTIEDVDMFLEIMASYDEDTADLARLRRKLNGRWT